MKALKITVITIVFLIAAYADAYGQTGNMPQKQRQNVSNLPPEFSNLSPQEKRALLNNTNGEIKALEEAARALNRSKQGAQAPDAEHAKCKVESAFDGSECLGEDREIEETTTDDEENKMLVDYENVKAFIEVIIMYNSDLKKYDKTDEQSVEALSVSRDEVREYGGIVIDNTDNVELKNVASGIINKTNRNNPVNNNDVEALKAIFKDCPVCN